MILDQITKTQKKIIIIAALVALVFLIFRFFIYAPGKKQMAQLKADLEAKQKEIDDIQMIALQGESFEQSIARFKERFKLLEGKFPVKEEESLRMISDLARKLKINLISINPSPKKINVDENQKNITVDNRVCQSVSVTISLDCSYKELVKYVELLRRELPALAIVEDLEVNKTSSDSIRDLKVRLGLSFYLLS